MIRERTSPKVSRAVTIHQSHLIRVDDQVSPILKSRSRACFRTYVKIMILIYPVPMILTRIMILFLPNFFCKYRERFKNYQLEMIICYPDVPENILHPVHLSILIPHFIFVVHFSLRGLYYLYRFCKFWPRFCRSWGTDEESTVNYSSFNFTEIFIVFSVFFTYFVLIGYKLIFTY